LVTALLTEAGLLSSASAISALLAPPFDAISPRTFLSLEPGGRRERPQTGIANVFLVT
jgi:hypothetical protein